MVSWDFETSDYPDAPETWAVEIRKVEITESLASNLWRDSMLNREFGLESAPVPKRPPILHLKYTNEFNNENNGQV